MDDFESPNGCCWAEEHTPDCSYAPRTAQNRKALIAYQADQAWWAHSNGFGPAEESHHGFGLRGDAPGVLITYQGFAEYGGPCRCEIFGCSCPSAPDEAAFVATLAREDLDRIRHEVEENRSLF